MPKRNRKYLDWTREQPCVFSGLRARPDMAVDPAHIGTLGKSIKSGDDEVLPVRHDIHMQMHQEGEITVLRRAPGWLLREMARAYAREQYAKYEAEHGNTEDKPKPRTQPKRTAKKAKPKRPVPKGRPLPKGRKLPRGRKVGQ